MSNPWDDLVNGWNGFWGNAFKPVNYTAPSQAAVDAVRGPTDSRNQMTDLYNRGLAPDGTNDRTNPENLHRTDSADSTRRYADPTANIARILGIDQDPYPSHGYTTDGNPGRQGNDDTIDTVSPPDEYTLRAQKIQDMIDNMQQGHANDALVDSAFAGSLAAIQKARDSANGNFDTSSKAVQNLTDGHVNAIKTEDRAAVQKNDDELATTYAANNAEATKALQNSSAQERSARQEMLSRMGIEAGAGTAGYVQDNAVKQLATDKAAKQNQAAAYKAADLTRNTEMAASQAQAGVERQADLHKQLNSILGNLDTSQATVENSKSQAHIAAQQADRSDMLKQLQFYQDQLKDIQDQKYRADDTAYSRYKDQRDFEAKNSGNLGGVFDVANNKIKSVGYDPAPYQQAYADVMGDNGYDSRSGQDKIAYLQQQMRKKNPSLDPRVALDYITTIENFGTDKANTRITG